MPKFHLACHVSTRHVRRVEPCCSTSLTQPKCMGSTRRTRRVVSRRDKVEFALFGVLQLTRYFQNH